MMLLCPSWPERRVARPAAAKPRTAGFFFDPTMNITRIKKLHNEAMELVELATVKRAYGEWVQCGLSDESCGE